MLMSVICEAVFTSIVMVNVSWGTQRHLASWLTIAAVTDSDGLKRASEPQPAAAVLVNVDIIWDGKAVATSET